MENLSGMLLQVIKNESEYKSMCASLSKFSAGGRRYTQGPLLATGLSDGVRNLLCAGLALEKFGVSETEVPNEASLIIVPDEKTAYSMQNRLSAFLENVRVFPARDFRFHNMGTTSNEWEFERLRVLRELAHGQA